MNWKSIGTWCFCIMLILGLCWTIGANVELENRADPDRYFHYALSKVTATEFAPSTVPQFEGIGWDKFFKEKEFLYHVLTGIASRIGGDAGVLFFAKSLGCLVFLLIFIFNTQRIPATVAFAVTLATMVSVERFLFRMFMVRPHILAIIVSIMLVWALLGRKHRWAAFFSFLFALSYHAIYIPILFGGLALIAALITTRSLTHGIVRDCTRSCMGILVGITIGVLVNPYFPSNVYVGLQVLSIAFNSTGLPLSDFGVELYSLSGTQLLVSLSGYILLICSGVFALGFVLNKLKEQNGNDSEYLDMCYEAIFLLLLALTFLAISFHNPRGIEFLVPISSLLLVRGALLLPRPKTTMTIFCAVMLLGMIPGSGWKKMIYDSQNMKNLFQEPENLTKAGEALRVIPEHMDNKKVLNCNWDISPYVYYNRPDLRLIDLLDPTFLYLYDKDKYEVRKNWMRGQIPDSLAMIKTFFDAEYVFCYQRALDVMRYDPHVEIMFPEGIEEVLTNPYQVLKVRDHHFEQFIRNYNYSTIMPLEKRNLVTINESTDNAKEAGVWPVELPEGAVAPVFVDLSGFLKIKHTDSPKQDEVKKAFEGKKDVRCAELIPTSDEIDRLNGATIAALGGGPHIELWINDSPVYSSTDGLGAAGLMHTLVRLQAPIASQDKVKINVCGMAESFYIGAALSLWREEDLANLCAVRKSNNSTFVEIPKAAILERSRLECVAKFAGNGN